MTLTRLALCCIYAASVVLGVMGWWFDISVWAWACEIWKGTR